MKKTSLLPIACIFVCLGSNAASFDCSKARSYSEKLICSNADISEMDDQLKVSYDKAKASYPDKVVFKKVSTDLWNQRNACSTEKCVRDWYDNSFSAYAKLSNNTPTNVMSKGVTNGQSEDGFIKAISKSQRENENAKNDMVRGGVKSERDDEICSIIGSGNVNHWRGKIDTLDANSDGYGVLGIKLADGITVKTWNNSISDTNDNTLLDPHSTLFKTVSQMSVGDNVSFSGQFLKDDESCVKEGSLSLAGGLSEPEFIFKFSSVSKVTEDALADATPAQVKHAKDVLSSAVNSFSDVCILIGRGEDDAAKNVINNMALSNGKKNNLNINQEQFEGIKDYFLQYRVLTKENCDNYAGGLIKEIYSQSN